MGQWFVAQFAAAGWDVAISDPAYPNSVPIAELARGSEIILLTTPLVVVPEILNSLRPVVTQGHLIADITSVKSPLAATLASMPCQVVSLHPLFGPRVPSLEGTRITWSDVLVGAYTTQRDKLRSFFVARHACLIDLTLGQHDEVMGAVQVLTHLSLLLFGSGMSALDVPLEQLTKCGTPPFTAMVALVGRMLSQTPDVYGEILAENPQTPTVIANLRDKLTVLEQAMLSGDVKDRVRDEFTTSLKYFGDEQRIAASELSDRIAKLSVG